MSLRSPERGLKFEYNASSAYDWNVAPFAGAWIEIPVENYDSYTENVAPFAGAWIEI